MKGAYCLTLGLAVGLCLRSGTLLADGASPEILNLAGQWSLSLNGVPSGTVRLPGTLDENGKGSPVTNRTETGRLSRQWTFSGTAEYAREIVVPKVWSDKRVTLTLELTRPSEVFLDGVRIGSANSLSVPHVYELPRVAPGKHSLAIRVLTPGGLPPNIGSHAVSESTQTYWNGVLGRIEISAALPTGVADLRVTPFAAQRRVAVGFEAYGDVPEGTAFAVVVEPVNFNGRKRAVNGKTNREKRSAVSVDLGEGAGLWDEFSPNLYRVRVALAGGAEAATCFGLRDFESGGHHFLCNGKKVFLRGRHDGCVFPLTAHPPTDKAGWLRHFGIARDWGLNHVRFHSWCPPEAAFEAADELGIFLQPELPVWGTLKKEATDCNAYLLAEGLRILKAYGNHPSFVAFALGNELSGDETVSEEVVGKLRAADTMFGKPQRLFTNGSNNDLGKRGFFQWMDYFCTCRMSQETWGSKDTHVRASFSFADAEKGGWINASAPNSVMNFDAAVGECPIPVIGHETGQFQTYPDYAEMLKYTGVLKPHNFAVFRARLENAGLGGWAARFHRDSGKWSAELYKADVEMNLRSAKMAGFPVC